LTDFLRAQLLEELNCWEHYCPLMFFESRILESKHWCCCCCFAVWHEMWLHLSFCVSCEVFPWCCQLEQKMVLVCFPGCLQRLQARAGLSLTEENIVLLNHCFTSNLEPCFEPEALHCDVNLV
jgi:hypothetical protein